MGSTYMGENIFFSFIIQKIIFQRLEQLTNSKCPELLEKPFSYQNYLKFPCRFFLILVSVFLPTNSIGADTQECVQNRLNFFFKVTYYL